MLGGALDLHDCRVDAYVPLVISILPMGSYPDLLFRR